MSSESSYVNARDLSGGAERSAAAEDPGPDKLPGTADDPRQLKAELDEIFHSFKTIRSDLKRLRRLLRAKEVYEQLHPESRHGGARVRKQDDRSSPWPGFVQHAEETLGFDKRTISRWIKDAKELETLAEEASRACYGTPLTNKIPILKRIAKIPCAALQRDLVCLFQRQRSFALEELRKYLEASGLCALPAQPESRSSHCGADDSADAGAVDSDRPSGNGSVEPEAPCGPVTEPARPIESYVAGDVIQEAAGESAPGADLRTILDSLSVATVPDALQEIQQLQAFRAEVEELRAQLLQAQEESDRLRKQLGMSAAPLPVKRKDLADSGMLTNAEFAQLLEIPEKVTVQLRKLPDCPARKPAGMWFWPREQSEAWFWQTEIGRERQRKMLIEISDSADYLHWCVHAEEGVILEPGSIEEFGLTRTGIPCLERCQYLLEHFATKPVSPKVREALRDMASQVETYAPMVAAYRARPSQLEQLRPIVNARSVASDGAESILADAG